MNVLLIIFRILIGMVFIFSGFVKGIDPYGSAYKFHDYFTAFNLGFLNPVGLPLAILLASAEFIFGVSLLIGYRIRFGIWGVMLFMSVFTPLTLVLAISNPIEDCGCFGDAIVLTNWQTFWKNIIIMAFVVIIFLARNKFKPVYSPVTEWSLLGSTYILFLCLSVYCLMNLPIMDFRPYRIGTYIPAKMEIPEGAPTHEYETVLIYEKDGVQREFTMENFPWQDSSWTFVDQKSFLVSEGYIPPIHDFEILSQEGYNITDQVLSDDRYSFLLVSDDMTVANRKGLGKADELALYCSYNGYPFYMLTSTISSDIDLLREELGFSFEIYNVDETTLKTIIRSNPGLFLIKDGIILGKWHHRNFPEPEELNDHYLVEVLTHYTNRFEISVGVNLVLFLFICFAIFEVGRNYYRKKML